MKNGAKFIDNIMLVIKAVFKHNISPKAHFKGNLKTLRKRLFKYTENLATKNDKFSGKKSDIFHISAQNIDCGYSLEPPQ